MFDTHIHRRIGRRGLAAACVFALLAPAALAEPATAELLDNQKDSVRAAQSRLIELGLLSGGADGVYGPNTGAALLSYQAQSGLEETGHLDQTTLEALTTVDPGTASAKDVQQRLIDLGYLEGQADGIIGPRSTEALSMFQRLNGLSATAKADARTMELLFSGEAEAVPQSLSSGSKGEDVKRLQSRLMQFGFFEGETDGEYGQGTVSAVKAFQQHLVDQGLGDGVAVDGRATPLTQYRLYDGAYSTYLRDVAPGVQDGEARRIKRRLNQLGYTDAPVDDVLDDYTVDALELFGEMADVGHYGDADEAIQDALFSASAPEADYCAPHDIASGSSGQLVREVEAALVRGGLMTKHPTGKYGSSLESAVDRLYKYLQAKDDPNAPLFSDPKALSREAVVSLQSGLLGYRFDDVDSDEEALRVQSRLYTLYYLPKSGIDGKFGRNSRDAIREFQAVNGLEQTGRPNETTLDLLFSEDAEAKPYPYRVEVSIDRQTVEVYQLNDGGDYELVQSFICSTGLHDATPRGIFLDGFPVNRWHYFEKFNCWAQYSFEITGDIMFHSVIYGSNSESTLRSGSLHALGHPASHGCIRLKVEDAKWLFEHCKRGTLAIEIY